MQWAVVIAILSIVAVLGVAASALYGLLRARCKSVSTVSAVQPIQHC